MDTIYHIPVLLAESVEQLKIQPDGTYIDLTFGGGGHSGAILKELGDNGRLVAFDQDADAKKNADAIDDPRFTFVHGNFRYLHNFMRHLGITSVNGILADLGVSWHQFDTAERGFSFRYYDSPLDMRMNSQGSITAADIVNQYEMRELADILRTYGEVQKSVPIAKSIVRARDNRRIITTGDLVDAIKPLIPTYDAHRFLARVFQAFRIVVNEEMTAIEEALKHSAKLLVPAGRLSIISYHSLEDRMVKNFIRTGRVDGVLEKDVYGNSSVPLAYANINLRTIFPTSTEIAENPRARSAKLRVAKKVMQ
jgi:16S rRNA (cytosine1402-N4)-methyltransferase